MTKDDNRKNAVPALVLLAAIFTALVILASLAFAAPVAAQTSMSGSRSAAEAIVDTTSQAAAGSISQGGSAGVTITNNGQRGGEDNTVYSSSRLENAPSLGGLALGGGHPCAFSPATGQVSVIGGGIGVGGMKVDEACMLMVMGAAGDGRAYTAAQYMIAARNPAACKAMEAAGMVQCANSESTRPLPRPSTKGAPATFRTCRYDAASNRLTVSRAGGASLEVASADCRAKLGI